MYAKDAGNDDVSNIRKKKSVVYSNAEGMGERMQQKIKKILIKIKDTMVSVMHSYKRMRQENNIYFNILVGLVFFAIVGTGVCMVANAREVAALRQVEMQKEKEAQEKKKAEEEAKKAEEAAKAERDKSMSLQPGVAVGTMDPQDDEKVVYLIFDDGPSANTQRVLDILDQYDAKATFFITTQQPDYFPMIKKVYDEGHTVGLHSYTHEYDQVYASVDAYFDDLEKIGEVAKEQLGFVPCFIRFPGGASNSISKKYSAGIMTQLTQQVLDKGYQYYDWNVSSGDGGTVTADQIIEQSETDEYTKVMLLFHDTEAKESTIQALPTVMEYYKNLGYSFKAIDRESLVVHHQVNN